jgi:diguanylate cyclase (GGDEF)-like protein
MTRPIAVTRSTPLPRPLQRIVEDARSRWWAATTHERDSPATSLAEAMGREELRVAYQPIVELTDERVVAVEALVRLPDPPHPDLATPAGLIAVAEAADLVSAVGTEVLVHACSQLAAWRTMPHLADLQVHVNVSPFQLRDDALVQLVERTLAITGLPPTALVLEVTETAAFEEDGAAEATLTTLSALDVEISIDDFGTGFASLDRLASTPARSIKLDRTFIASIGELHAVPRGRALVVQAAIGLGRALGLRVVAEGIETPAQARTLAAWGCLYGQGYLYARPAFAGELLLPEPSPETDRRPAVWHRSPDLSSDAVELALAVAVMASTTDPSGGSVRADAQALALRLADICGLDRGRADIAAVLATIADAPQRFAEMVNTRSEVPAAVELARVLATRGDVATDACPGGIATAARQLVIARRNGTTLSQALRFVVPDHDPAIGARLDAWWLDTTPSPSPLQELPAMEHRLRNRDDATRRLRALSALTQAIGGTGTLEDVLDVTAEEARAALGASSLSIVRFEREAGRLRTLINVGDLRAWQQRRAKDETYPLSDFPATVERLLDRGVHLQLAGGEAVDNREGRMLEELGKGSSASVPIVIDNVTWGVVHATTAVGSPPFTTADSPFLTAVASVVSLAIRRFEHVDHLVRLAEQDPLTRIANRRALQDRLASALATGCPGTTVGLLLLDVEELSELNTVLGHAEGDRVLVRVADVISRVALTRVGAFPARLGGDEFCIALEGDEQGDAGVEDLLASIRQRLADGPSPRPTLSAGFASVRPGTVGVNELLRRADAAQYLATRTGASLESVGPEGELPPPVPMIPSGGADPAILAQDQSPGRAIDAALRHWGGTLDDPSLERRLQGLGEATGTLLDLNRWVISAYRPEEAQLQTTGVHVRRRRPNGAEFFPTVEESFAVADYPATARALREGTGFSVHVDDPAGDREERSLLRDYGQCYVLALPAGRGEEQLLLELYGDERSTSLLEARPVVEALASRTLQQDVACPPSRSRRSIA